MRGLKFINLEMLKVGRIRVAKLFVLRMLGFEIKYMEKFRLGSGVSFAYKNSFSFGRNVYVGRRCHFAANLVCGDDVLIASNVSFVGGDHKIVPEVPFVESGRDILKTIVLEDNVWIGHGAIIMHGVRIKSGSVVAAGAVVTKDVEASTIVGGNPATRIRTITRS